jgi:hypothetical protein
VGDLRSVSHWAKVSRELSAPAGSGLRNAGTPGFTPRVGFSQSPRFSTEVMRSSVRATRA